MAKIACCHNCVYSYCDQEQALWSMSAGVLTWPACANHPDSLGRMQRIPPRGICPNYRSRPATPEGQVKQIPVGEGLYAYVDAADFDWLNRWTWSLYGGYAARREKKRLILMHREIMQPPKGMVVDHKNHNKLDDTRDNLWNTTPKENARNRRKRRDASSRFIGVHYNRQHGKWYVRIRFEGERIHLAYFTDEVEAARAYDRAAVELFGEAAVLNFPGQWPLERRREVYAQPDAAQRREEIRRRIEGENRGATGRAGRKISARRKIAGKKGRKTTAGRKPRGAGRKNAATRGTERSRSKRAAKNKKERQTSPARSRAIRRLLAARSRDAE